ncbi:epididymal secretory glutathione peroxidase isoform X2 [Cavia porcellus]|uniref:epididymal secretory glutathione peroxidase isoform X2 n=1 Tax=Cavia porcellus TaxID=10141 RepID=UPI000C87DBCB|nr:epididymal secretory glutathione peroxidase isoform X2 [Cavia porcellus]
MVTRSADEMDCFKDVDDTIFNYEAVTLGRKELVHFSQFAGKLILVVNVATYCGLTSQYPELNALQEELKPFGLVVLGFPCNQFGKQEPGDNSEILPGLKHVRPGGGFVPNFQLFEKGDVNGENEQKIFTFLKVSDSLAGLLYGLFLVQSWHGGSDLGGTRSGILDSAPATLGPALWDEGKGGSCPGGRSCALGTSRNLCDLSRLKGDTAPALEVSTAGWHDVAAPTQTLTCGLEHSGAERTPRGAGAAAPQCSRGWGLGTVEDW